MEEPEDEAWNEGMQSSHKSSEEKPDLPGGKVAEVDGLAGLLGQTASILSLLVKQEEEKPKFSLNPEDVEIYKEAFNDFDHNKDGHISTQVRSNPGRVRIKRFIHSEERKILKHKIIFKKSFKLYLEGQTPVKKRCRISSMRLIWMVVGRVI